MQWKYLVVWVPFDSGFGSAHPTSQEPGNNRGLSAESKPVNQGGQVIGIGLFEVGVIGVQPLHRQLQWAPGVYSMKIMNVLADWMRLIKKRCNILSQRFGFYSI